MSRQNLSKREIQVGELLVQEKTPQEIAKELHISPSTVHTHIDNIEEKSGHSEGSGLLSWLKNWV